MHSSTQLLDSNTYHWGVNDLLRSEEGILSREPLISTWKQTCFAALIPEHTPPN